MRLEQLGEAIGNAAQSVVTDVCREVCESAKALCPVESGALRASITVQAGAGDKGATGMVSAAADYAAAVELGTFRQCAKPFLQPALAQAKGRVAAEVLRRVCAG